MLAIAYTSDGLIKFRASIATVDLDRLTPRVTCLVEHVVNECYKVGLRFITRNVAYM